MNERSFAGISQLSFRSILIGSIGSCIITASSMYVALKMGALPWPTIFVAVLSMALLKVLGRTTLNEINITQTAMSAGAMVAGGLAFTLPGLWILGIWDGPAMLSEHFWQVLAIALAGMLLGTVLTWFLRPKFVEGKSLPYPIGAAAAETIAAGDKGGKKSAVLFGTMGFSALFTYLRDQAGWIPGQWSPKWLYAKNFYAGIAFSPMMAGIGYMIGLLYTGVWFIGAILTYLLIIPVGPAIGLFPTVEAAVGFKTTAGIGILVGTGVGILLSFVISLLKKLLSRTAAQKDNTQKAIKEKSSTARILTILSVIAAFVFSIMSGLAPLPSVLLIAGVFAASAMAATITGQTGINPMEIFGIIILLAVRLIVNVDTIGAFFIAACVAVACGYAGDLLNDYKAGQALGTNPRAQLVSQVVGGVIGTVVAAISMFAVIQQFGGVGADKGLLAVQAFSVSQMVNGIGDPLVFGTALSLGAVLYLLKVPVMTLGIGIILPFEYSFAVFAGGIIRFAVDRFRPASVETGNITASGFLGGEGITGVAIAIVKMLTGA